MQEADVDEILEHLRELGNDHSRVEVKKARGGLPARLWGTISAFANASGGVLLLGIDEARDFAVVGVLDAGTMERQLGELCVQMTPPIRAEIQTIIIDGAAVVVMEVPALRRDRRPCFYSGEGPYGGSYVRVADGDRKLTQYEVALLLADQNQPRDDERPVIGATLGDLDRETVGAYVRRLRRNKPRVADLGGDDEGILRLTRALVADPDGRTVPSVAGLLALGSYPQGFLPQVNLTFVNYPSAERGVPGPRGERFLDNVDIDGPIPILADEAMRRLRQRMARRSIISGLARRDVYEYPEEAVREAVVNALAHRDLGTSALGTQVQVEMFPDRLEIRNPGGLYGPVSVDELATATTSSSRNGVLYKILEYVELPDGSGTVCENRGSGIRAMIASLRQAGMSLPEFHDDIASFLVVFPNATLLDDETIKWLGELGQSGLTDSQVLALARMRRGETLKNATYRQEVGVDSRVATAELRDLVERQLVDVQGSRGSATYSLAATNGGRFRTGLRQVQDLFQVDDSEVPAREAEASKRDGSLDDGHANALPVDGSGPMQVANIPPSAAHVWQQLSHGPRSRRDLEETLGLPAHSVLYRLRLLRGRGLVETDGPLRSRTTRWRRAGIETADSS